MSRTWDRSKAGKLILSPRTSGEEMSQEESGMEHDAKDLQSASWISHWHSLKGLVLC